MVVVAIKLVVIIIIRLVKRKIIKKCQNLKKMVRLSNNFSDFFNFGARLIFTKLR